MIRDSGHAVAALEDMIPNFIGFHGSISATRGDDARPALYRCGIV